MSYRTSKTDDCRKIDMKNFKVLLNFVIVVLNKLLNTRVLIK